MRKTETDSWNCYIESVNILLIIGTKLENNVIRGLHFILDTEIGVGK